MKPQDRSITIPHMKTIAITIDDNMLQRIDNFVAGNGEARPNRSQIIRQAVQEYLERMERLAEEEREREIFRRHRQRLARQATALVKEQAKL
ncbi:MAG: CopG family ribbon-helix-helix protein [Blastocatellales bacterium]